LIKLNDEKEELLLRRAYIDKSGLEQEYKNYCLKIKRKNSQQVGGDSNKVEMFDGFPIPGGLRKIDKDD